MLDFFVDTKAMKQGMYVHRASLVQGTFILTSFPVALYSLKGRLCRAVCIYLHTMLVHWASIMWTPYGMRKAS